jgi:uncharacterized membrane protein YfcA
MEMGYIASGLLVGILVGLTGVGGGSLMTPLLVFLFGFEPKTAIGTDLLFAALTKSGGVLVHHHKHRSVEWHIVGWLALGSLPSAMGVVYLLKYVITKNEFVTYLMTTTLGISLILTALSLVFRGKLAKRPPEIAMQRKTHHERFGRWQNLLTLITGIFLGVLVTLTSVGAGALGTVVLLFLYPRLATVRIVGTDLAHAIPLTAVAGFGHWLMGNVDFTLLGSLLIGSLPGIYVGSYFSAKIPEKYLRPLLALILLLVGVKFVS